MQKMLMQLKAAAAAAAVALVAALAPLAHAEDVVRLKDGTVLRGEIQREFDGWIWMERKIGEITKTEVIDPNQVESIERDAEGTDQSAAQPAQTGAVERPREPSQSTTINTGAPKGVVVTLEGMVGMQFAVAALEEILPLLEQEVGTDGSGIVVLKINSGGGLGLEVPKLQRMIQETYKRKFRTVAWIESAISAAAMTAHPLEEIYFMPEGNYGACTGWYGNLQNVEGRQLEEYLAMMERVSVQGGHDPLIMRSMQIQEPLSATVLDSGEVMWFKSTDAGEHLVNPEGKILTFNSLQAQRFRFSRGTAATLQELQELMRLPEVEWVGRREPGELFPISRAEEAMRRFRQEVTTDEENTRKYLISYQSAVDAARSAPADLRGRFVGEARNRLVDIERMVHNNPNFALMVFNATLEQFDEWVAEQREMLSELLRNNGGGGGGGGGGRGRRPGGGG